MKTQIFLLAIGLTGLGTLDTIAETSRPMPSKTYLSYCASCHGKNGDGLGKAARYLYPKPRSFIGNPIQYARADNRIASLADIKHVIKSGIPNTSMTAWSVLSDEKLNELANDVRMFQKVGAEIRFRKLLYESGDIATVDAELPSQQLQAELDDYVSKMTGTGSPFEFKSPEAYVPSPDRGKATYTQQNCHKCHGVDGRGSYGVDLIGEFGFPVFARDLIRERFKHGESEVDLARVIRLGIHGTKMPASPTLTSEQTADLIAYLLSRREISDRALTNAQRYQRAIGALPKTP